jgi:hypothetical protein
MRQRADDLRNLRASVLHLKVAPAILALALGLLWGIDRWRGVPAWIWLTVLAPITLVLILDAINVVVLTRRLRKTTKKPESGPAARSR